MTETTTEPADATTRPSRDDVQWLGEHEQIAWRTFIFGATSILDRLSQVLESDPRIDLTLSEYEILVRLSESEHRRLRMSDLADRVVHSRSRLTHTVSRMEKRGLLERVRCVADGRGREAALTDEGMALLELAAPVHVQSVRDVLLDPLGHDDFLELGRILGRTLGHEVPCLPASTSHGR